METSRIKTTTLGPISRSSLHNNQNRAGGWVGCKTAHNNRTARSVTRSTSSTNRNVQGVSVHRGGRINPTRQHPAYGIGASRRGRPRPGFLPHVRSSLGRSSNQPQPATPSRKCVDELPQLLRNTHIMILDFYITWFTSTIYLEIFGGIFEVLRSPSLVS